MAVNKKAVQFFHIIIQEPPVYFLPKRTAEKLPIILFKLNPEGMKQLYLISMFVLRYCMVAAQNMSPATTQISSTEFIQPENHFPGEKYRGTWVSYYSNGRLCDSGYLINNKPDGLWRGWYPNGQLRVQMQTSAKRLSSATEEMERLYRPGFSPGPHIKEMKQLQVSSVYPYDKFIYRQLYIATHPPDVEDGVGPKAPFTECMVHGVFQSWFENGILKDSGYCDNGVREGVWEEWDEEANMRTVGFYKNGLRWKDWRYYNKEGKLDHIKVYNRQEEVTETIVLK